MRLLVSCLLVVLAAACSPTDDTSSRPAPGVDEAALHDGLAAIFAGDHPSREDRSEGDCFADALLDSTTPEELRAGGLTDASYHVVDDLPALPEELAGRVADAQLGCTDFVEDSTQAQVSVTKGRIDPEAYAGCLRASLTAGDIRAGLVATLRARWDDPAVTRIGEAQAGCAKSS